MSLRQKMRHGAEQCTDRMTSCSVSKIFCRHVQVDLRAGDLSMAEQIANGHEAYAGSDQVRRKRVAQLVR